MDLARHYFISTDLDDLERIEMKLESGGISTAQIHVLTRANASLQAHKNLHGVTSLMKRDIVHSGLNGVAIGAALAAATLAVSYAAGWTSSAAGWMPFVFLGAIILGFCTWFGGMHGLRVPNHHFKRFQKTLDNGKHVLFVDIEHEQHATLRNVVAQHPGLVKAGNGQSIPSWLLWLEKSTSDWWYWKMWRHT